MAHLIDKDALVAEIERSKSSFLESEEYNKNEKMQNTQCLYHRLAGFCDDLLSFLNTLEMKEVDLEKSLDDYINSHFSEGCDNCMISDTNKSLGGVTYGDLSDIAKYFFNLGLKSQNQITISQQRLSVLKMEFWTGLETFNASEMTLSDAYNKGIEDVLEELDIEKI